jgi:hypothetical protein
MLELSPHIVDRQYWLHMIIRLGSKALTKENRALLSYMLVFSPKAELIYNRNPDSQIDNLTYSHLNSIVHFLESFEQWINQLQPTIKQEEELSELYAYRTILSGCKCYIYQCLDNHQVALKCAFEAISYARKISVPHLPVLVVLAHVIRFLLKGSAKDTALTTPLFFEGVSKIRAEISYALNIPYVSLENNLPRNEFTKSDLHNIHILCSVNSPLSLITELSSPTEYIPSVPMDPLFCDFVELSNEVILGDTR